MAADPLSPIAPARIRALLLPMGRIRRSRFLAFVDLLQQESLVRLGDISPDPRPDRNMFSPLAWPDGTLLYDLSTSLPSASYLLLSPFEQFREPLLVIGLGDASEYAWLHPSRATDQGSAETFEDPPAEDESTNSILFGIDDLREQFPRAYLHRLMMFDSPSQSRHPRLPPEALLVPPKSHLKTTTLKTLMCDLTATLLAEMTTLAKSIQALPTLTSPASQNGMAEATPNWAASESMSQFPRRSSQVPSTSRPVTPVGNVQRDMHRASMPILPSSSGSSVSGEDQRPASVSTQDPRTPATTFDEISGVGSTSSLPQNTGSPTKSAAAIKADRVSIHGFGSGGVSERARNKGRGRISIVIGTLYMCAGQWVEAIRELTEGATRARTLSDHLWHAKALENIMVCMLLFAWSGMEFQIPQICYPGSDKSNGIKSPHHTPTNSSAEISASAKQQNLDNSLDALSSLLPDLVHMILNLYTRAANFAGESLPPLAFSECIIRFSKLLAAVNLSAGYLDDDSLRHLVQNVPYKQKSRSAVARMSVHPTRNDIASMLFRALPGPVETCGMNPTERVVILAGIASVLSSLGLQRKKAIVMKDFITSLIPGLIQARKVGAAEMGVHPAAGLAALNIASSSGPGATALNVGEGEVENGIGEFLGLIGQIYGIPNSKGAIHDMAMAVQKVDSEEGTSNNDVSQREVDAILAMSSMRCFGSLSLKLEVLRTCLSFCEALPDFNGVLHFTALLLRIAGPGTAPKPNSTDVYVSLSREEQVRLYSNISRTVTAAKKLGFAHVETEYWDDFLVRGLFILDESEALELTQRQGEEIKSSAKGKDGPFLHNAWAEQPQTVDANTTLVANEEYRFVIALQNPYDFELGVESLRFAAEGVEFVGVEEHFLLGPYRTQKFQITGKALSAGELKIIGCYVKLIGCRERLFPIFPEPWKPKREPKMKRLGLKACLGTPTLRPLSTIASSIDCRAISQPKPELLTFSVIQDQPILAITNVSLPQAAVMVLEGERKRFKVTVKNLSPKTAVDFVHISFQDTAMAAIHAATSNKDLPPAELHELEVQLAHYPSLQWCKDEDEESLCIKPGAEMDFTIEVVGRTRLTDATIQIDYANIGKRRFEIEGHVFTRRVSTHISITVNASVQLQRPDIVPLPGDVGWFQRLTPASADKPEPSPPTASGNADTHLRSFINYKKSQENDDEYCMLLLDVRNSWPNPLSLTLEARRPTTDDSQDDSTDPWKDAFSVTETIQPGHVSRIVLILPKIYLHAPHAAVPSLNPANQRQFVVSTSKISPETERASREAFWYRQKLLTMIRGTWTETGNGRHGALELRGIRLSPRMVDAIKMDDLAISMTLVADHEDEEEEGEGEEGESIKQLGRSRFSVPIDTFVTLRTRLRNRSPHPISPLLRLQPHLASLPHALALDLDKRLSWSGALQRRLALLPPGGSTTCEVGLVALCSGAYEVGGLVEEVEVLGAEEGKEGEGRGRGEMEMERLLQGDILGERKLRSWGVREPCRIFAVRGA